mmetsp:Transcript_19576/g.30146  ORF Transcript_19576/g.30146 Transcript_19576/m.30146 type:complete len:83 (+) Transcript_19576:7484-7732(+)
MGPGDLLELCVAILCLGDQKLFKQLQTFLESLAAPATITRLSIFVKLEDGKKVANSVEVKEAREFLSEEKAKHKDILRHWIQ